MSDEKKEKAPQKVKEAVNSREAFIARKLKVINEMPNKAKAKELAERVLRNKEVR